jgi:hypothetical protein
MRRFATLVFLCSLTACGGLSEEDLEAAQTRTKAVCACKDLLCVEKARAAQPGVSAEVRAKLDAKDRELLEPLESAELDCYTKAAEATAQVMLTTPTPQ